MNIEAERVYNYLLEKIRARNLCPGDRVPSEPQLTKTLSSNPNHVYSALKRLESEGMVNRKKGIGTTVSDNCYNSLKRSLQKNSERIDVIIMGEKFNNRDFMHWNDSAVNAFESFLHQEDYTVRFHYFKVDDDVNMLKEMIEKFNNSNLKALVIIPHGSIIDKLEQYLALFLNCSTDIFMLNFGACENFELPFNTLSLDPFSEGVIAANYLINKNHSYFVTITVGLDSEKFWARQRIRGSERALTHSSIKNIVIDHVIAPTLEMHDMLKSLKDVDFKKKPVFITQNDLLATKLIDSLKYNGLILTKDYFVISFDNHPQFRHYNLTTIAPSPNKWGEVLAKMILGDDIKNYENDVLISIRIKSKLIIRQSS